jgi:Uma2 family endonuclease
MIAKLRQVYGPPAEQRLRLSLIPWETYVTYSDALGPRRIRVTYDDGEMEIMTLSPKHEHEKTILARLVEALTEEVGWEIRSFGSMTSRRKDMKVGLEPDECYWIENEPLVRGRDDIDLAVDPPPDLALEIEISRGTLNRMDIYAALGVPEVWCWDGRTLRVLLLYSRKTYRRSRNSRTFPFLPLREFADFLKRPELGENELIRSFRAWVRKKSPKWDISR